MCLYYIYNTRHKTQSNIVVSICRITIYVDEGWRHTKTPVRAGFCAPATAHQHSDETVTSKNLLIVVKERYGV